jgi:hypothetical protein
MKSVRLLVPAIFIVALSAYMGVGVFGEWAGAVSAGQRAATICHGLYAVAGVLAGIAALWYRRWLDALLAMWVLTVVATAGLAPVVWGGAGWIIGLVSGLAGAAFAGLIAWWLRSAARHVDRQAQEVNT